MRERAVRVGAAEAGAGSAAAASETSAAAAGLRGLSYDDQMAALAPAPEPGGAAGKAAEDKDHEVQATDVPGVLYSNTSKTNLNKESDWVPRLGFALATAYTARVTLDDLIVAGQAVMAPPATAVGPVRVPPGAGTKDAREYDYIESPTGRVSEKGVNRFALRGGAGAPGGSVELSFANNGALNLARLARAAYELALAKGLTVRGGRVDYHGKTLALSCAVQMGNEVDAEGARAYGYVGELDLRWMQEKVSATIEDLCAATVVAMNKGMVGDVSADQRRVMSGMAIHPNHEAAIGLRTDAHERVEASGGRTATVRKQGVSPIESPRFKDPTTRSWGMGAGQQAWIKDPAALAAAAQGKLRGSWAPRVGADLHPTYITECPDFSATLAACFAACGAGADKDAVALQILQAVQAIGAGLMLAPMERPLIGDAEHQAALEVANKKVIAAAFAGVNLARILDCLKGLQYPQAVPEHKGGADPVLGEEPNGEGLVLLRDWTSRDK